LNVLIVNWPDGENDPFTFFNINLKRKLQEYGCRVDIVNIDSTFGDELPKFAQKSIDFALTWQGVGANAQFTGSGQNAWEQMEIPLICLHGDHPSHMPANHSANNRFVKDIYLAPSFCRYSNKYFVRNTSALFFCVPNFFPAQPAHSREGNFFVFPKNLDSPEYLINGWRQRFPPVLSEFLANTAYAIIEEYKRGDCFDHHQIIDNLLTDDLFAKIRSELKMNDVMALFHHLHSMLDHIYRNAVAESVIEELRDIPLVVNGRGWDTLGKNRSSKHVFNSFGRASDGDSQFYSNYGIVDVTPGRDSMHDRTFRAISHNGGFLSNSRAEYLSDLGVDLNDIFYDGKKGRLRELAEAVVANPSKHRDRCAEFGKAFSRQWSFPAFYTFLNLQASR
jgi:hypothetical protein